MDEFTYIDWLRQQTHLSPQVLVGPGDDTAVLAPTGKIQLVTTDMLLEGSCFLLEEAGPYRVGRKAMAVNLSDIAAMAGRPTAAVVSVGLPRSVPNDLAQQLYLGLRDLAQEFGVSIVGGDTNSWSGSLAISVTLFGEATSKGPVLRSGARVGDWLLVTGPLGGSIRGKHLDFQPRVREALALHQCVELRAMIDISDGLARDAHHLCEESHCGAILFSEQIPISDSAHLEAQRDGRSALDHALSDGEDFELAFTVSPEDGERLIREQPIPGITIYHIGEMVEQGYWLKANGMNQPLQPRGYEHQW